MQFDAVIIGGGPAGLSVASELSRNWCVLEEARHWFHAGGGQPFSPDHNPGFDFAGRRYHESRESDFPA